MIRLPDESAASRADPGPERYRHLPEPIRPTITTQKTAAPPNPTMGQTEQDLVARYVGGWGSVGPGHAAGGGELHRLAGQRLQTGRHFHQLRGIPPRAKRLRD